MKGPPLKPLFIFSLPKSGSTLLQRMLAASGRISTTAEPWFLLFHLYALKPEGVIAEYWHGHAVRALEDFYGAFPRGKADYLSELNAFALNLYRKRARPDSLYFLDKTPRYHLICKEVTDLFPEGKFIFLWRNPLAVAASILHRWNRGKWKIRLYDIDLYVGLERLLAAAAGNAAHAHFLRYEDLVENPAVELEKACGYLGIEYTDEMIRSFYNVRLDGRMAEHTGSTEYRDTISRASVDHWKSAFINPFRRRWALRYLDWIGAERLRFMGYDADKLKQSLKTTAGAGYSLTQMAADIAFALMVRSMILTAPMRVHFGRSLPTHYL